MSLEKKQRRKKAKMEDADMADSKVPKIEIKSKAIQKPKKDKFKKSRKQLLH